MCEGGGGELVYGCVVSSVCVEELVYGVWCPVCGGGVSVWVCGVQCVWGEVVYGVWCPVCVGEELVYGVWCPVCGVQCVWGRS